MYSLMHTRQGVRVIFVIDRLWTKTVRCFNHVNHTSTRARNSAQDKDKSSDTNHLCALGWSQSVCGADVTLHTYPMNKYRSRRRKPAGRGAVSDRCERAIIAPTALDHCRRQKVIFQAFCCCTGRGPSPVPLRKTREAGPVPAHRRRRWAIFKPAPG